MSPFTYYVGVICHLVSKHFVSRASVLDNTLDIDVRKRLPYHVWARHYATCTRTDFSMKYLVLYIYYIQYSRWFKIGKQWVFHLYGR